MKRYALVLLIVLLLSGAAFPALAQNNADLITLNDATPAIDVVITLPPDTTGTISLDMAQAAATLTDAANAVVFHAADERLHGLQLNIAPNSGSHTLTVERLPGMTEAYVRVTSLPEMTMNGSVHLVDGNTLSLNQEVDLSLNADNPGGTVAVNVPVDTQGAITANFPGADATSQLVDSSGIVLAQSNGGHVDGAIFVLNSGSYDFTVLGNGLTSSVVAGIRAVSAVDGGFNIVQAPAAAETVVDNTCTATVSASSVNLRSGPGTGYTVIDYGYRGDSFAVGGQNPENNWIVVGTDSGSAWVSKGVAQMQGVCDALTVFNIPLRDAAPAQIIISSPGSGSSATNNSGSSSGGGNSSRQEHEGHEQEHENDD